MFLIRKNNVSEKRFAYAVGNGKTIPMSEVNDEVFSSEIIGPGIALECKDGTILAPFDGSVVMTTPTNHAIGVQSADGLEILIHIGLETVNLGGEGFKLRTTNGAKVRKGQALIDYDRASMIDKGLDLTICMIATNWKDYDLSFIQSDDVVAGETAVLSYKRKNQK